MIFSFTEASVDEVHESHLIAAWSNLVVGSKPPGLVDCFLMRGEENIWHVAAVWEDAEALEEAHREESAHPAFVLFEAANADPTHTSFSVVGRYDR